MTNPSRDRVWRTSSFSNDGSDCFEVSADLDDSGAVTHVHLRHSKHPTGTTIALTPEDWATWLAEVEHGITNTNGVLDTTLTESGWLLHERSTGHLLTFTTSEVVAFQQGVTLGEFTVSRLEDIH